MRKTLLVAILVATAACGTYHFPAQPPGGTGTVSGQVMTAYGCGVVGPASKMCVPPPGPQPIMTPVPCESGGAIQTVCGPVPVPGFELDFTNGATTVITKTDSTGSYSIELAAGTWTVSSKTYMRILSGPTTLTMTAGASIVANYIVVSGIEMQSGTPPLVKGPD